MKNRTFSYFLNWILLGLIFGLIILALQDKLHIQFGDKNNHDATTANGQILSYSQAVANAAPSVVYIQALSHVEVEASNGTSLKERFFGSESPHRPKTETITSSGSGVILDLRGYILTNYHVIKDADEVLIGLNDGRTLRAEMIGKVTGTDLAVLKIAAEKLPLAKIADMTVSKIGDIVLAIGFPYTIGQTVTQGIISATGRSRVSNNAYEDFIQTDAAINPGNSGGALINTSGEIIGINSLIYTRTGSFQGIGFAIPIDIALKVLEDIIEHGYVVRGWLGVEGQEVYSKIFEQLKLPISKGILITSLDSVGPAQKAGLKTGDIITHINNNTVTSVHDIMNVVAEGQPGESIEISGLRMRQSFTTNVVLGEQPMNSQ